MASCPMVDGMHDHVTLDLHPHLVSAAKGAGNLAAEAGGGDATGPKAGAVGVVLPGGELCRWLEGEALEAGIQCP